MARLPIITYAGGKGPRQCIWEGIRSLAAASDQPFTEEDIWRATHSRLALEMGPIRDYRRALVAGGILAVVTPATPRQAATYRLANNVGVEAPRLRKNGSRVTQGLAQEQMWRTLRMMTCDTNSRELAAHASTVDIAVAEVAARDYLRTLHEAGYLVCTRQSKAIPHGRSMQARYRLKPARNTGPRPPMVCRSHLVYDPNEDKIVWQPPVTEEDVIYAR